jgi:hypothetical protein
LSAVQIKFTYLDILYVIVTPQEDRNKRKETKFIRNYVTSAIHIAQWFSNCFSYLWKFFHLHWYIV